MPRVGESSVPTDSNQSVGAHLSEASIRIQRVVLGLLLVAIGWAFVIDDLFSIWLGMIPLAEGTGTLSIYSPYSWLDTRWTAVGLLALWTVMPWLSWEAWRFARPGLLPHERSWLSTVLAVGMLVGSILLLVGWMWGVPSLVGWAQGASAVEGVGIQYDVVSIFQTALAASWFALLVFLLSLSLVLGRALGLIGSDPLEPFRLRLHLIAAFLLYIVTPPALQGLFLPGLLTLSLGGEWVAYRVPVAQHPRGRGTTPVLDGSGQERRVLFVDCSCEGACPRIDDSSLASHVGMLSLNSLCLDGEEQEALADRIQRERIDDVVIGGCDGTPLPWGVKHSLETSECSLSGLGRLWGPRHRSSSAELGLWADTLDLARASRPWSEAAARRAQLQSLTAAPEELQYLAVASQGEVPWGVRLQEGEVLLAGSMGLDDELVTTVREVGISLRVIDS